MPQGGESGHPLRVGLSNPAAPAPRLALLVAPQVRAGPHRHGGDQGGQTEEVAAVHTVGAAKGEALALPDGQPLPFSAKAGIGQRELWQYCQDFCRLSDEAAALKQKKK